MKIKVVYFTRTGNSKRIAEKISEKLLCDAIELKDTMNWKGVFGFIKGGYYAVKKKAVSINTSKELGEFDALIIVSPLWADGIVPAVRGLLATTELEKVSLVVSSSGSIVKERAGYHAVYDIVEMKKNEDEVIDKLVADFKE